MIDEVAGVGLHASTAEHLEQILRVVATVADPLTAEDLAALQEDAIDTFEAGGTQGLNFAGKFRGDSLIGVERQDPFALEGQVCEGPLPLPCVGLERMAVDGASEPGG